MGEIVGGFFIWKDGTSAPFLFISRGNRGSPPISPVAIPISKTSAAPPFFPKLKESSATPPIAVDVAAAIDRELAQLGMEDLGYSSDENLQPNAKLVLFFKGVATALQRLREKIPRQLADESRKIYAGAL